MHEIIASPIGAKPFCAFQAFLLERRELFFSNAGGLLSSKEVH